eukprot:1441513-Rhodomonas_salina.2
MKDSEVLGGTTLRDLDKYLDTKYGGYHSANFDKENPSWYAKFGQPTAEHTYSAATNLNAKEWAPARDEFRTIGKGLHQR